jgi:hypothetical protein
VFVLDRESIRLTQNVIVVGLGLKDAVVVEAPGWEPALVFAGLGISGNNTVNGVDGTSTGERAEVNIQ